MNINWKLVFSRFSWYIVTLVLSTAFCMFVHVTLLHVTDMSYVSPMSFFMALFATTITYPGLLITLHEKRQNEN